MQCSLRPHTVIYPTHDPSLSVVPRPPLHPLRCSPHLRPSISSAVQALLPPLTPQQLVEAVLALRKAEEDQRLALVADYHWGLDTMRREQLEERAGLPPPGQAVDSDGMWTHMALEALEESEQSHREDLLLQFEAELDALIPPAVKRQYVQTLRALSGSKRTDLQARRSHKAARPAPGAAAASDSVQRLVALALAALEETEAGARGACVVEWERGIDRLVHHNAQHQLDLRLRAVEQQQQQQHQEAQVLACISLPP